MRILSTFNVHLARTVVVAAALFAISVSALAVMTGEFSLLIPAVFAIVSGAYGLTIERKTTGDKVPMQRAKQPVAA